MKNISLLPVFFLWVSGIFLSGCILGGGSDEQPPQLKPGAYYSDYGAAGRSQKHESELVLDPDGSFHFFVMSDTTPWTIIRGNWEYHNNALIEKSAVMRNAHYSYVFDGWSAIPTDTSYLRNISDGGFEHLEISEDSGFYQEVVRWVQYHRMEPPAASLTGRYEFSENYPDAEDSTVLHSGSAYLEFLPDGSYKDGRFQDGKPLWEFTGGRWFLSGSFLIVQKGRERDYADTGFGPWQDYGDSAAEYVVRTRSIGTDSFQQWAPEDQSFQNYPHWIAWHRKP